MRSREYKYIRHKKFKKDIKNFKRLLFTALAMTPKMSGEDRDMNDYKELLK